MFDSDILLAFAFMGLLFVREIVIIKRPNKINYAPLTSFTQRVQISY